MQIYLLISEFRIYASLTLRFAYKRVFVYMQLGYMQAILPVPSTCIYPSSTVIIRYNNNNNERITRALFHVKHAQLR